MKDKKTMQTAGTYGVRLFVLGAAACLSFLTGCTHNPGDTRELKRYSAPVRIKTTDQSAANTAEARHVVPLRTIANSSYVALDDIASATGYSGAWIRSGGYGIGDTDAAFVFRTGASEVEKRGKTEKMPAPAIKEGNRLYISAASLGKLFGEEATFVADDLQVSFFAKPVPDETGAAGQISILRMLPKRSRLQRGNRRHRPDKCMHMRYQAAPDQHSPCSIKRKNISVSITSSARIRIRKAGRSTALRSPTTCLQSMASTCRGRQGLNPGWASPYRATL